MASEADKPPAGQDPPQPTDVGPGVPLDSSTTAVSPENTRADAEQVDALTMPSPAEAAFTEAFQKYSRMVRIIVGRIIHENDTADDVAQEAFMKVWARWETYTEQGTDRGSWIARIAINAALDQYRRTKRSPEEPWDYQADEAIIAIRSHDYRGRQARQPTPESAYEARNLSSDLAAAINRLSSKHRDLIIRVDLMGMSYPEAAKDLGIPRGTVMSRLHRARAQLRRMILEGEVSL